MALPTSIEIDKKILILDQMKQIPKFSGTNPYYTFKIFKKEFMEWAEFFSWGDTEKLFVLKKSLEGRAYEIFTIYEDSIQNDKELFDKLAERLDNTTGPNQKLKDLWNFKQTPDMPVSDFISLARKKAKEAAQAHTCTQNNVETATEEWLLSALTSNILPQYRKEILRNNPKTSAEFEKIALVEERAYIETQKVNLHENAQCTAISATDDKMIKLLQEMQIQMSTLNAKIEKLEKQKEKTPNKPNLRDITCFRCQKRGHKARDCRVKLYFENPNNETLEQNSNRQDNTRGRGGNNNSYTRQPAPNTENEQQQTAPKTFYNSTYQNRRGRGRGRPFPETLN